MRRVSALFVAILCVASPAPVVAQDEAAGQDYSRIAEELAARRIAALPIRWENLVRQQANAESGASCDARIRAAYAQDFRRRFQARHQRMEAEAVQRYGPTVTHQDFIITLGCRREPTAAFRDEQLALFAASLRWFEDDLGIRRFSNDELAHNRTLLRILSNEQLYDVARSAPWNLSLEHWCQTRNLRRSYERSERRLGREYLAALESARQTLGANGQLLVDDSANDILAIFIPPSVEQCRRIQRTLPLAHVALAELERRASVFRSSNEPSQR